MTRSTSAGHLVYLLKKEGTHSGSHSLNLYIGRAVTALFHCCSGKWSTLALCVGAAWHLALLASQLLHSLHKCCCGDLKALTRQFTAVDTSSVCSELCFCVKLKVYCACSNLGSVCHSQCLAMIMMIYCQEVFLCFRLCQSNPNLMSVQDAIYMHICPCEWHICPCEWHIYPCG